MKQYFMGIDIGTYESRGMLIGEDFRVTAEHTMAHGMSHPRQGWFEHDADKVWWGDFCGISRRLIEAGGIAPEQISCIGASTLGTDWMSSAGRCARLSCTALIPGLTRKYSGSPGITAGMCEGCSAIPSVPATRPRRYCGLRTMSRRYTEGPINFSQEVLLSRQS